LRRLLVNFAYELFFNVLNAKWQYRNATNGQQGNGHWQCPRIWVNILQAGLWIQIARHSCFGMAVIKLGAQVIQLSYSLRRIRLPCAAPPFQVQCRLCSLVIAIGDTTERGTDVGPLHPRSHITDRVLIATATTRTTAAPIASKTGTTAPTIATADTIASPHSHPHLQPYLKPQAQLQHHIHIHI